MVDIRSVVASAVKQLIASSGSPQLDAQLLLAHVLDVPRAYLFAHPEQELSKQQAARFEELLESRRQGRPVAQLTGVKEFWSLPLMVSGDVLVPRPETELLVNLALAHLRPGERVDIADLGTGCGAIALALAVERPHARIVAVDSSDKALDLARRNATRLGLAKLDFRLGDWCEALPERKFHLIVSNPPYVPAGDPHLDGDIRHEPVAALVSGEQGLTDLGSIAEQAKRYLRPGGYLVLEHGHDQRDAVVNLLLRKGYQDVRAYDDEGGTPRAVVATWPQAQ